MDYHKRGYLPMNYSKSDSTQTAIGRANWSLDYGNTTGDQYSSR